MVNGLNGLALKESAATIAGNNGATVIPVVGDVSDPGVQRALLAACPGSDILVNNNGGPPRQDFRELDRKAMAAGVVQNIITPIELIQAVVDGMAERGFGRIVNITSMSVRMPIEGWTFQAAHAPG